MEYIHNFNTIKRISVSYKLAEGWGALDNLLTRLCERSEAICILSFCITSVGVRAQQGSCFPTFVSALIPTYGLIADSIKNVILLPVTSMITIQGYTIKDEVDRPWQSVFNPLSIPINCRLPHRFAEQSLPQTIKALRQNGSQ